VRTILVAVLILGTTAGYTLADDPPPLDSRASNPCEDPYLLELRSAPVDSLSEREFEMLKVLEERCTKHGAPSQHTRPDEGDHPAPEGDRSRRPSAMIVGGAGIPVGEFEDDDADVGIGGTLRVEFPVGDRVSLGPSLGYHRFPIRFDEPEGLKGRWEIGTFGLGLSSAFDKGAHLFCVVGVALPDVVATFDLPLSSDEAKVHVDPSPIIEGGLRFGLARGPLIELMYSRIFTDGKKAKERSRGESLSSRVGYDIHWVSVRAGINLIP
jgi:hypothetical protein